MSLARVAVMTLPDAERADLVRRGVLSPVSRLPPFSPLEAYGDSDRGAPASAHARDPALDAPVKTGGAINFDHRRYAEISRAYAADAASAMRAQPGAYGRGVLRAVGFFVRSPTDDWMLRDNRERLGRGGAIADRAMYAVAGHTSLFVVAAIPLGLLYAFFASRARALADRAGSVTLLFMGGTIAYVALVGTLLDAGENNRFRFPVDAFLFVLAALAIGSAWRRVRRRPKPSVAV